MNNPLYSKLKALKLFYLSMKRMKGNVISVLLMLITLSCSQPTEVVLDYGESQLVLNSIIDAQKDTINVTLSQSRSIVSTEAFQRLNGAHIELYENQELIGNFENTDEGVYVLRYRPIVGMEYEIVAQFDDKRVVGKTIVPESIPFTIEKIDDKYNDFKLKLNGKDINDVNAWVNVLSTYFFVSDTLEKVLNNSIYSNSDCLDPFNRTIDPYRQYAYNYSNFLLLTGCESQSILEISFGLQGSSRSNEIVVNSFDVNLTNYLKSSKLAADVENRMGNIPFYVNPVKVFSNIQGGIGVVGSINSNSIELFNKYKLW